jgi:SAM-dependent methyltransferase
MAESYRGLVARMYDVWFPPGGAFRDAPFYRRRIEKNSGPALEIGCGTGRLLLPYLQAGLTVEGLDSSRDMLDICRAKAHRAGLVPTLHEGRMEALATGKKYHTIFVPLATIQLLEKREQALEALRRFRAHLVPGGELVVTLFVPWKEMDADGEWRVRRTAVVDGETFVLSEAIRSDRGDQSQTWWLRYDVVRDVEVRRSELHTMHVRWYHRAEFELMLEACGFPEHTALGDFDDAPATAGADLIFVAR